MVGLAVSLNFLKASGGDHASLSRVGISHVVVDGRRGEIGWWYKSVNSAVEFVRTERFVAVAFAVACDGGTLSGCYVLAVCLIHHTRSCHRGPRLEMQ